MAGTGIIYAMNGCCNTIVSPLITLQPSLCDTWTNSYNNILTWIYVTITDPSV